MAPLGAKQRGLFRRWQAVSAALVVVVLAAGTYPILFTYRYGLENGDEMDDWVGDAIGNGHDR